MYQMLTPSSMNTRRIILTSCKTGRKIVSGGIFFLVSIYILHNKPILVKYHNFKQQRQSIHISLQ